jgi:hypothetical protein
VTISTKKKKFLLSDDVRDLKTNSTERNGSTPLPQKTVGRMIFV